MFHELWIIFDRPFSAFEVQTCENILRDFDTSKLTTETPELRWGRFFIGDDLGFVTMDEAEESATELCDLINLTVNIKYQFEHIKISVMKAIDFEKSALEHGLAIGSKKDFFWVESLDDRIWCLLLSKSAIDFANSLNLEKEAVEGGAYLIYFSG